MMSFLLGLGILGLSSSQDAYAISATISGQASCEAVPGGVWDTNLDFCTLTQDLTIEEGEVLEIFGGLDEVFVSVPSGVTITIESGGAIHLGFSILSNSGTILNSGEIRDIEFADLLNFGIIQNFGFMIITTVFNDGTINSCGGTETFFNFTGNLVTSDCPCTPPASGDWTVSSTCTMTGDATANGNVIVQNNSVLVIPNGITLTIPSGSNISILSGGGLLIEFGGTVIVVS